MQVQFTMHTQNYDRPDKRACKQTHSYAIVADFHATVMNANRTGINCTCKHKTNTCDNKHNTRNVKSLHVQNEHTCSSKHNKKHTTTSFQQSVRVHMSQCLSSQKQLSMGWESSQANLLVWLVGCLGLRVITD